MSNFPLLKTISQKEADKIHKRNEIVNKIFDKFLSMRTPEGETLAGGRLAKKLSYKVRYYCDRKEHLSDFQIYQLEKLIDFDDRYNIKNQFYDYMPTHMMMNMLWDCGYKLEEGYDKMISYGLVWQGIYFRNFSKKMTPKEKYDLANILTFFF